MFAIAIALLMVGPILSIPRAHADSGVPINAFGYHPLTSSEYCYPNNSGNYCVGIAGTLLQDTTERDPNNDFYGIKLTMFSLNATGTNTWVTDLTANIQVNLPPSQVSPAAGGIQPPSGTVQQQTMVMFCDSNSGVCISGEIPSGTTTYNNPQGSSIDTFSWHVTQSNADILNGGTESADFGVIIIVPENTQFTVSLSGSMTFSWRGSCTLSLQCSSNSYPVDGTLYTQPNSTPDFWTTFPSTYLNVCPGTAVGEAVRVSSLNGFSGTVNVAASIFPTGSQWANANFPTVNVSPSSSPLDGIMVAVFDSNSFTVVVTLTSGSISHFVAFTAVGNYNVCGGGGGGGGSVAKGTEITMADGRRVPVQDIRVGDAVVVYNVPTGYQTIATVYDVTTVVVNSTLTITTTAGGAPFRADANPHMNLWVMTPLGPLRKPITTVQPGDQIYNYDIRSWVTITDVTITYGGLHTFYDVSTNPTLTNTGLLLEDIANGYPDCGARGCKM